MVDYTRYQDPWAADEIGATPIEHGALNHFEDAFVDFAAAHNDLAADVAALGSVPAGLGGLWFAATAPSGWILLRGQAISRTTYAALFSLWGTTYGAGDGTTTFNIPNLERRIPIGKAASGAVSTLGETAGTWDHQHNATHAHTGGTTSGPNSSTTVDLAAEGSVASVTHAHTFNTPERDFDTGTGNPPVLVINFIALAA